LKTIERVTLLKNSKPDFVIYWHHLINHTNPFEEGYIGITSVTKYGKRFAGSLANNYKGCTYFYNVINKYKEDNIITTIIQDGLSKEEANELELLYRPKSSIGWNIRQGGGNKGSLSQESKNKISKTKKGTNHLYYDKIFTVESREKIRQSKIGNKNMVDKSHSAETLIKMKKTAKGRKPHENTVKSRHKKVICIETGVIYNSQVEAQSQTGINHKYISDSCRNNNHTAGGFHWKLYKEKK
jgi:hypothetical protein